MYCKVQMLYIFCNGFMYIQDGRIFFLFWERIHAYFSFVLVTTPVVAILKVVVCNNRLLFAVLVA